MKNMISPLILALLFFTTTSAQYNKVFYDVKDFNSNLIGESARDIVDAGNGHTCVLTSTNTVFSLKELDVNGAVVCEETFYAEEYIADQLIRTSNGEYLVVGHLIGLSPTWSPYINPFVGRFQKDPGNPTKFICMWLYEYSTNTDPAFANRPFAWRTSIVLAEDDLQEAYIIAAPGDDSNTPIAGSGSTTIQAFKITANGTLVWNNKYYDQGGSIMNHYVTTLAYGSVVEGQPPLEKYFIGGNNDESISFDMTIDGNGNIVDQYREYDMPGDEYRQAVIYDDITEEFVLANTMTSTSAGNSINQVAVSKIDFSSMIITSTDFYYENDPASTNCMSRSEAITEDAPSNYYLIGANTTKNNNGTATVYSGPSILKIDKAGTVQFFNRYNRLGESVLASITTTVAAGPTEYYAVCGGITNATDNYRVFTTDVAGSTCGEESLSYGHSTLSLSPVSYSFTDASISGRVQETPITRATYRVRDCDPGNPEYKPGPTAVQATVNGVVFTMDAYPNPVHDNLTVQLNGDMSGNARLTVIDLTGKTVYNAPVKTDKVIIDAANLPSGIYIVKYTDDVHNEIMRVTKK